MDVEGLSRVCQAEMADQIAKRLGSCSKWSIGGVKPLDRCLHLPP
jgi:hypothetical protein